MDFKEILYLSSYLDDHKKKHPDFLYYFALRKGVKCRFFYINEWQKFIKIMNILKKYCILHNFYKKYEVKDFLGSGHFADVYSVKKNSEEKLYAAKIIQTNVQAFQKNKV